ncbi:MAG: methyltransferase domain-containing protein [Planctomycetes bacterium]|nr:methyltransferase domain-containing protein [Planctomycetota bacterium]
MNNPSRAYDVFAEFYDRAYADWRGDPARFLRIVLEPALARAKSVVDLGCGTGLLSLQLARRGFDVEGVERHPEMYKIAKTRAAASRGRFRVVRADICKFTLTPPRDVALCFFDTLNHLARPSQLGTAFRRARRALRPGGSFVFDVNTPAGVAHPWPDPPTFERGREYFRYARPIPYNSAKRRGGVQFEWFVRQSDGHYKYTREQYIEIAWTENEIEACARDAGFEMVQMWDGSAVEPGLARGLRAYYWFRAL